MALCLRQISSSGALVESGKRRLVLKHSKSIKK
jgi:hypothetical protein